ncbi:MAG: hypothetical protein HQ478_05045 [Chloroflexi bacterium]|nr:hypothetical protein [Chloroflexota bacterium]
MSPAATVTRKRRSPLAPAYSAEHCFEVTARLHAKISNRVFDQAELASVLGISPGASTTDRLVSSLRQFGLVDKGDHGLTLTERASVLVAAKSSNDPSAFRVAALETVDSSPVFKELRESFGAKLPPSDALVSRLEKSGFTTRSAKQTASALRDSLRFAGVVDDDDNIIGDLDNLPEPVAVTSSEDSEITPIDQVDFSAIVASEGQVEVNLSHPRIDVPLEGGRVATVLYPPRLSRADVEKVYAVLDALIQS